jgi:outer membrane protein TolC
LSPGGLIILLLFSFSSAGAAGLGFEDGKALALANSRLIKAYDADADSAEYRRRQAVGGYMPQVTLSETWTETDEPANAAFSRMAQGRFDMDYFLNELPDPSGRITNYRTKLEVVQPILMNGRIFYGVKQADAAHRASLETAERIRQHIVFSFNKAFFGLALAEKALSTVKVSYGRTDKYYTMTRDFYDNGLIVMSDLLVAETYLLMNDQAVKEAEKNFAVASSQLQRLLDTDESISIIWEDPAFTFEEDLDKYINTALRSRQDLKAMLNREKAAGYEVSKSKGNYLPQLMLFADYQRNDDEFAGDSGEGYTFGAQMNLNVFRGGSDFYKVKEEKANHLALLHRIADKKLEIKSEVKEAYYAVLAAEKQLEAAKKRVESASNALDITENRFREGLSKITELLDREVDLRQAELSLYMSEYDLIVTKARLHFASGTLS